jgi:hypothetical protein
VRQHKHFLLGFAALARKPVNFIVRCLRMNPNTHIYLYAKGWYKQSNVIDDLKKILGNRSGIEPKYITQKDILAVLLELSFQHIIKSGNPEHSFYTFATYILPEDAWKAGVKPGDSTIVALVKSCLSILCLTEVNGLDLGKPDETLLPLMAAGEMPPLAASFPTRTLKLSKLVAKPIDNLLIMVYTVIIKDKQ